ncbi:hypothetical protein [Paenibacillus wynnii]|uniref:Uncharacterized protein n=1 Tax=Paenibacillus wynnii TaxID=268407 RepID=A0A098MB77_9BACL|nr:hypothetical protein [Paenibacillus wynnii]KGE19799.1 hypothetical protein PWYN_10955 [Paenibacillus wynnii]
MSDKLWQWVQGMKGGTLALADIQMSADPAVFEKFKIMFEKSSKTNVYKLIETMKGEWPM